MSGIYSDETPTFFEAIQVAFLSAVCFAFGVVICVGILLVTP